MSDMKGVSRALEQSHKVGTRMTAAVMIVWPQAIASVTLSGLVLSTIRDVDRTAAMTSASDAAMELPTMSRGFPLAESAMTARLMAARETMIEPIAIKRPAAGRHLSPPRK